MEVKPISKETLAEITAIQKSLVATKNKKNPTANYQYRSAEDILEALKPLAEKQGGLICIKDDIVEVSGRFYVEATVIYYNSKGEPYITKAYAREQAYKKNMDEMQITGSASSYARKYALNAMFCIDDGKDADTMDNTDKEDPKFRALLDKVKTAKTAAAVSSLWKANSDLHENVEFKEAIASRGSYLADKEALGDEGAKKRTRASGSKTKTAKK